MLPKTKDLPIPSPRSINEIHFNYHIIKASNAINVHVQTYEEKFICRWNLISWNKCAVHM